MIYLFINEYNSCVYGLEHTQDCGAQKFNFGTPQNHAINAVKGLMRQVPHLPVLTAVRSRLQVCRFGSTVMEMCSPQGPEWIGALVDPRG